MNYAYELNDIHMSTSLHLPLAVTGTFMQYSAASAHGSACVNNPKRTCKQGKYFSCKFHKMYKQSN